MAVSVCWELLKLLKEGPRIAVCDRNFPLLLDMLRTGAIVGLNADEYALLRTGGRGRSNICQLIGHFFNRSNIDGSLCLVWREPESGDTYARMLDRNQTHMAAQTFGLPISGVLAAPRFHRGICRLELLWGDEWFALPGGWTGWVQAEQSEPLGDTVEVVLGFYDTFPALPRDRLVYVLDEATERRLLERRWSAHRPLVTSETVAALPQKENVQRKPVREPQPLSVLEMLVDAPELPLPLAFDDRDDIWERLFIRGQAVEIPRWLYGRLVSRPCPLFRSPVAICAQDEDGRAHLFWTKGARCFTRLLDKAEVLRLGKEMLASA